MRGSSNRTEVGDRGRDWWGRLLSSGAPRVGRAGSRNLLPLAAAAVGGLLLCLSLGSTARADIIPGVTAHRPSSSESHSLGGATGPTAPKIAQGATVLPFGVVSGTSGGGTTSPANGDRVRTRTPTLAVDPATIPGLGPAPAVYAFYVWTKDAQGNFDQLVHEADTASPIYTVPAAAGLADGDTYYWAVDAEWEYDWWESSDSSFSIDVLPTLVGRGQAGWLGRGVSVPQFNVVFAEPIAADAPPIAYTYRIWRDSAATDPLIVNGTPWQMTLCTTSCTGPDLASFEATQRVYYWTATASGPGLVSETASPTRIVVNTTFANPPPPPVKMISPIGLTTITVDPEEAPVFTLAARAPDPADQPGTASGCNGCDWEFDMTELPSQSFLGRFLSPNAPDTGSGVFQGLSKVTNFPIGTQGYEFKNLAWYRWSARALAIQDSDAQGYEGWFEPKNPVEFRLHWNARPLCVDTVGASGGSPGAGTALTSTPTLTGWYSTHSNNTALSNACWDTGGGAQGWQWKKHRAAVFGSAAAGDGPIWTSDWRAATAATAAAERETFVVPSGVLENGGTYYWGAQSSIDDVPGPWSPRRPFVVRVPAGVPTPVSPASGATIASLTPALTTLAGPPGSAYPVSYQVQVASDSACATQVWSNATWSRDGTIVVPQGVLLDGRTYYWRARARNAFNQASGGRESAWSACRSFQTKLPYLGKRGDWAMWQGGPLGVHLKTGNLTLDLPGPSYPTLMGSMGLALSYNSHVSTDLGFGPGLAVGLPAGLSAGASPTKISDHNLPDGRPTLPDGSAGPPARADREDVIEVVGSDGISELFYPTGDGHTYVPEDRAGATLRKRAEKIEPDTNPPAWTLTAADGSVYTFADSDPRTGDAQLIAAQATSTVRGKGKLGYKTVGGLVVAIYDEANRALALDWAGATSRCTGAIVCVSLRRWDPATETTAELFPGEPIVWRYIGSNASGTQGPLSTIEWDDGQTIRKVLRVSWLNGRITEIKDANTLANESAPTPQHNGTYAATIGYDASTPAKISFVEQGPVTGQTGSATARTSFAYSAGGTTDVTRADHAPHIGLGQTRTADGNTTITSPRGGVSTIWYDHLAHPIQTRDSLGRTTQTGWSNDLQVWSEDATGAPSDTTYDPLHKIPTSAKGPAVAVAGQANPVRPESLTFYDERMARADAVRESGPVLTGLRAEYFDNRNLAGRPVTTRTDAQIDFDWSTGAPGPLMTPFPVDEDFSVRWTGTFEVAAGTYYFKTIADGGTRVSIDGVLVLSRWADVGGATTVQTDAITLTAGRHTIEVGYSDGSVASPGASVRLVYRVWDASSTTPPEGPLASAGLRPAYLNATSSVSPTGRRSFSHFPEPWTGLPDYTLVRLNPGQAGQEDLVTSLTYDQLGRPLTKTMPRGNIGRVNATTGELEGAPDTRFTTSWVYYALDATDPTGQADVPACLGQGAMTGVFQAGQLKEKRVPGLATQSFVYDASGRVRSQQQARGRTCTLYTPEGRLQSVTTRADDSDPTKRETTTNTYDAAGQVLTTAVNTYRTDPGTGQIVAAPSPKGTLTNEYDEAGRVVRTLDSFATPPPGPPGTATDGANPTVSLTSPAAAASVTGSQVSVTASASDDVRLRGVQFKLDGVNLGPEDTAPPFRVLWDSTKSSNANHVLTAVATDAANKSTTSAARSVTVTNTACPAAPVRSGLVAAYDFDEGSGTTLADWSGGGNPGTITGATWITSGLCDKALLFDGVDDWVTIADAPNLDLSNAMTIEAWINPTALSPTWRAIILKEASPRLAYSLYTTDTSKPRGSIVFGTTYHNATGTTNVPLNTWTHMAATLGSGTLRIYVNGVQVGTKSVGSSSMSASTGPLRLGGNAIWGEFFQGRMDDVRIYNRALSSTEIQQDMYRSPGLAVGIVPEADGATEATYRYEPEGNLVSRTVAPGEQDLGDRHTVEYTYNTAGQPLTLTLKDGQQTPQTVEAYSFYYDTRGALKAIQYPNNTFSWRSSNAAGWQTKISARQGSVAALAWPLLPDAAPPAATLIADYTYDYLADGKKRSETLADGASTQVRSFTYDDAGRLSTYSLPNGTVREYRFDEDSNRTQVLETPSGGTQVSVATYTYNPGTVATPNGVDQLTHRVEGGQMTIYGYTADGDLSTEVRNGVTVRNLGLGTDWDGRGLLVSGDYSGTRVSVTLDPAGNAKARGSQGKVLEYLHAGGAPVFERNAGAITSTNVDGPDGPLSQFAGAAPLGTKSYLYFNGHGDLAATANTSGVRQGGVNAYDPFGAGEGQTLPPNTTTERYTGKWHKRLDTTSGLISMGVRPYDPALGRFLAVDPVEGGSANNYDYADQDPIGTYDLTGTHSRREAQSKCMRDYERTGKYSPFEWLVVIKKICKRKALAHINDPAKCNDSGHKHIAFGACWQDRSFIEDLKDLAGAAQAVVDCVDGALKGGAAAGSIPKGDPRKNAIAGAIAGCTGKVAYPDPGAGPEHYSPRF